MGVEFLLVAIELIALHKLDGTVAYVNPAHIVQLAATRDEGMSPDAPRRFPPSVRCVVGLLDGRYITVRETCDEVRKLFIKEEP